MERSSSLSSHHDSPYYFCKYCLTSNVETPFLSVEELLSHAYEFHMNNVNATAAKIQNVAPDQQNFTAPFFDYLNQLHHYHNNARIEIEFDKEDPMTNLEAQANVAAISSYATKVAQEDTMPQLSSYLNYGNPTTQTKEKDYHVPNPDVQRIVAAITPNLQQDTALLFNPNQHNAFKKNNNHFLIIKPLKQISKKYVQKTKARGSTKTTSTSSYADIAGHARNVHSTAPIAKNHYGISHDDPAQHNALNNNNNQFLNNNNKSLKQIRKEYIQNTKTGNTVLGTHSSSFVDIASHSRNAHKTALIAENYNSISHDDLAQGQTKPKDNQTRNSKHQGAFLNYNTPPSDIDFRNVTMQTHDKAKPMKNINLYSIIDKTVEKNIKHKTSDGIADALTKIASALPPSITISQLQSNNEIPLSNLPPQDKSNQHSEIRTGNELKKLLLLQKQAIFINKRNTHSEEDTVFVCLICAGEFKTIAEKKKHRLVHNALRGEKIMVTLPKRTIKTLKEYYALSAQHAVLLHYKKPNKQSAAKLIQQSRKNTIQTEQSEILNVERIEPGLINSNGINEYNLKPLGDRPVNRNGLIKPRFVTENSDRNLINKFDSLNINKNSHEFFSDKEPLSVVHKSVRQITMDNNDVFSQNVVISNDDQNKKNNLLHVPSKPKTSTNYTEQHRDSVSQIKQAEVVNNNMDEFTSQQRSKHDLVGGDGKSEDYQRVESNATTNNNQNTATDKSERNSTGKPKSLQIKSDYLKSRSKQETLSVIINKSGKNDSLDINEFVGKENKIKRKQEDKDFNTNNKRLKHNNQHSEADVSSRDCFVTINRNSLEEIGMIPKQTSDNKTCPKTVDKTLKKPESKSKPKEKIFKCSKCSLHFLKKIKLLEHILYKSKNNICENKVSAVCEICGLKFRKSDIIKHCKNSNHSITDFNIITDLSLSYNTSNSVHNSSKNEKEKIENTSNLKSKQPEPCMANEKHEINVPRSIAISDGNKTLSTPAKINKETFQSTASADLQTQVSKPSSSKENQIKRSSKLSKQIKSDKNKNLTNEIDLSGDDDDNDHYTVFKCQLCNVHFDKYSSLRSHRSNKNHGDGIYNQKVQCRRCSMFFATRSINVHIEKHHFSSIAIKLDVMLDEDKKLETITITNEQPLNLSVIPEVKKKLNYNTLMTRALLKTVFKSYSKTIYKCSVCNVYFVTKSSMQCHFREATRHFFLNNGFRYSAVKHENMATKECEMCNLTFNKVILNKHRMYHHNYRKMKKGPDFNVIIYSNEKNVTQRKPSKSITHKVHANRMKKFPTKKTMKPMLKQPLLQKRVLLRKNITEKRTKNKIANINNTQHSSNILYKCTKCEICFINENDFLNHLNVTEKHDIKERYPCPLCSHNFSDKEYLRRHMKNQHVPYKTDISNFIVLESVQNNDKIQTNNNSPEINNLKDICVQLTPLQSTQVSTTSEENIKNYYANDTQPIYKESQQNMHSKPQCELAQTEEHELTYVISNDQYIKYRICDSNQEVDAKLFSSAGDSNNDYELKIRDVSCKDYDIEKCYQIESGNVKYCDDLNVQSDYSHENIENYDQLKSIVISDVRQIKLDDFIEETTKTEIIDMFETENTFEKNHINTILEMNKCDETSTIKEETPEENKQVYTEIHHSQNRKTVIVLSNEIINMPSQTKKDLPITNVQEIQINKSIVSKEPATITSTITLNTKNEKAINSRDPVLTNENNSNIILLEASESDSRVKKQNTLHESAANIIIKGKELIENVKQLETDMIPSSSDYVNNTATVDRPTDSVTINNEENSRFNFNDSLEGNLSCRNVRDSGQTGGKHNELMNKKLSSSTENLLKILTGNADDTSMPDSTRQSEMQHGCQIDTGITINEENDKDDANVYKSLFDIYSTNFKLTSDTNTQNNTVDTTKQDISQLINTKNQIECVGSRITNKDDISDISNVTRFNLNKDSRDENQTIVIPDDDAEKESIDDENYLFVEIRCENLEDNKKDENRRILNRERINIKFPKQSLIPLRPCVSENVSCEELVELNSGIRDTIQQKDNTNTYIDNNENFNADVEAVVANIKQEPFFNAPLVESLADGIIEILDSDDE